MEAVGRLTGGVAHDFNNLLTVILANARLLARRAGEPTRVVAASEMIAAAAKRGADLTGKLLAFARRQPLDPQNVDVSALLGEMQFLLRGSLGENFPIVLACEDGLWPALVDPGQLEASVLNLCFNARDAMHGGGAIRISAANRAVAASATVGEGDLAAQSQQAFDNLRAALAAAGATTEDVAKMRIYVVNYEPARDGRAVFSAVAATIGDASPASTLVSVPALSLPQLLIEVEAIAVID